MYSVSISHDKGKLGRKEKKKKKKIKDGNNTAGI